MIAGPTASGKSAFALELAEKWDGVIVNTDSMQVYPLLQVLTARPGKDDLARVPHRLYGHASLAEPYSVAQWLGDVREVLEDVQSCGKIPIFAGGTGLYFKALTKGLALIPDIPRHVREYWRGRLQSDGIEVLARDLQRLDPSAAELLRVNDRNRILRALEVFDATGKSILDYQRKEHTSPLVNETKMHKYVFAPDRDTLRQRINVRFDQMIGNGALEEVKSVLDAGLHPDHPAMKAIGVPQLNQYLNGEMTLENAIEKCKIATRQYAKRQATWFRNQLSGSWTQIG